MSSAEVQLSADNFVSPNIYFTVHGGTARGGFSVSICKSPFASLDDEKFDLEKIATLINTRRFEDLIREFPDDEAVLGALVAVINSCKSKDVKIERVIIDKGDFQIDFGR